MPNALKVKLVAIAKDEAAYLPEWIFHHLHFGFDAIDIYVNNTSDNTEELAKSLRNNKNVQFLDGNDFFNGMHDRPQVAAYTHAIERAKREGFTHLLYLDIDEYWVPRDFLTTIHDCIESIDSDVISFEWFCKLAENEPFTMAFQNKIEGKRMRWVKSLFALNFPVINADVHNVHIERARYKLSNGRAFSFEGKRNGRVAPIAMPKRIQPYFIVHRMYRSELEYVSMLAKGRPKVGEKNPAKFKNNRNGYSGSEAGVAFTIANDEYAEYVNLFNKFIKENALESVIKRAREFVIERFKNTIKLLKQADKSDEEVINKVFNGITLPEVTDELIKYRFALRGEHLIPQESLITVFDAANALKESDDILANKLFDLLASCTRKPSLISVGD